MGMCFSIFSLAHAVCKFDSIPHVFFFEYSFYAVLTGVALGLALLFHLLRFRGGEGGEE